MKTFTTAALGFATTTLFAATAYAGEAPAMDKAQAATSHDQMTMTKTVETIDADGQVGILTIQPQQGDMRQTAVLGAFAAQNTDAYIVEDTDGTLYINHLLAVSDLPDPTLRVFAEDTFKIQHRGMTFTNKVVSEE